MTEISHIYIEFHAAACMSTLSIIRQTLFVCLCRLLSVGCLQYHTVPFNQRTYISRSSGCSNSAVDFASGMRNPQFHSTPQDVRPLWAVNSAKSKPNSNRRATVQIRVPCASRGVSRSPLLAHRTSLSETSAGSSGAEWWHGRLVHPAATLALAVFAICLPAVSSPTPYPHHP